MTIMNAWELQPGGRLRNVATGKWYTFVRHAEYKDFTYLSGNGEHAKYRPTSSNSRGNELWVMPDEQTDPKNPEYEFLVIDLVFTEKTWIYEPPKEIGVRFNS